jgi:hypothetical protein
VTPTAATPNRLKVFISYSRRDVDFAQRIVDAIEARGIAAKFDTRDLPVLEDWRRELIGFIREADAIVFIVSPNSIASPVCGWELDQVAALNKRLAPIVLERVPDDRIPASIAKINYIFFDAPKAFEAEADVLATALQTDLGWLKNHTRFGERARAWEERGHPGSLMLRGTELEEAEKWLASHPRGAPEPTQLHREFVSQSRRAATRQLRYTVAGSLALAVFAIALAAFAFLQRQAAVRTLATSDFQRGSVLLQSDDSASEGMALLARSVRRGNDQRALTRLWTLLQQREFWLPVAGAVSNDAAPVQATADGVPDAVKKKFGKFRVNGAVTETSSIAVSGDGKTVFTVLGGGAENNVRYRLWRIDGTPVTDWITPEYHGEQYLYAASGALSFDGRFLALEVAGWRETSVLRIFDMKAKKQIGGDIAASGALPAVQGQGFSLLRFFQLPQSTAGDDEFVWLLTESTKGDATVFRVQAASVEQIARNQHTEGVVFAAMDADFAWLMSSSSDGTVRVSAIGHHGDPVGNVLKFANAASSIARVGSDGLAVSAGGEQSRFSLRPRASIPLPANPDTGGSVAVCKRWDDDKTVVGSDVETLLTAQGEVTRVGTRQISVGKPGQKSYSSPVFATEIIMVCVDEKAAQLAVTLRDFTTELWAPDFSRRFGLPIVERRMFGPSSTPTTTAMTLPLRNGNAVMVESYFWDPPNIALLWFSIWDSESALPLMDRAFFADDISEDNAVQSARVDSTGRYLIFVHEPDEKKIKPVASLQIEPPASASAWIADFAEAVAGVSVSEEGALVPAPDRLAVLARGSAELARLTAAK